MKIVFEWDTSHPMEHEIRQLCGRAMRDRRKHEERTYRQIEEIDQCPAYLRCHPWHGVDNDLAADDEDDVD